MTLSIEELREVAKFHKYATGQRLVSWLAPVYAQVLPINVQPKERPRSGRSGHFYTPKKTQDCEEVIRDICYDAPLLLFPISIRLSFYEQPPKSKRNGARWLRPSQGDLDNKIKTVTDALNGVLYRDDKQICGVTATRYFASVTECHIEVYRDGLSPAEWESVQKLLPHV